MQYLVTASRGVPSATAGSIGRAEGRLLLDNSCRTVPRVANSMEYRRLADTALLLLPLLARPPPSMRSSSIVAALTQPLELVAAAARAAPGCGGSRSGDDDVVTTKSGESIVGR